MILGVLKPGKFKKVKIIPFGKEGILVTEIIKGYS